MTPKRKRPPHKGKQLRIEVDKSDLVALRKCTALKLADKDADARTTRQSVIRWALRKCAAEVREG